MRQLTYNPVLHRFGAVTPQQGIGVGVTATTALAPTIASTIGLTTALGAAAAIPIVGAAIAALGFGIEAILNSGCGQSCIETSNWANQAETLLQQNIAAYFAIPAPRPASVQAAAVANAQSIINYLFQQCSQVSGGAGTNCISDRKAGACKWKALAPQYPGQPATGTCWNWDNGYRAPIANDPNVVPDAQLSASSSTSAGVTGSASGAGASFSGAPSWMLWAAAGLILLGVTSN